MMDLIESGIKYPIRHWYYSHKFWFIERVFLPQTVQPRRLLDIGAGSALFSIELLKRNLVESVVAVDTGYETDFKDPASGIEFCRRSDYQGFTDYLLTDVLEHVENDLDFLSEIVVNAPSNSQFVITVPALMSLWSNHDVFLKHFRRYTKKELEDLVSQSGLSIDSCRYTYCTVFPLAYLQRKLSKTGEPQSQLMDNGKLVSRLLKIGLTPDKWISHSPFGVSLFMVAHKPT
jgi:hypothetical protein